MSSRPYCCSHTFRNKNAYEQHQRSHLPSNIECTHCYDKFAEHSAVLRYMESYCSGDINRDKIVAKVHRMDPLGIITLNTNYENDDGSHMSQWDESDYDQTSTGWICLKCNKEFTNENAVTQHLDSPYHHRPEFYCRGCDKVFSNLSGLAQHFENKRECLLEGRRIIKNIINALRSGRLFKLLSSNL